MNIQELQYHDDMDYRENDKVVCISVEEVCGPLGCYPMNLELGKLYVVHGVFDYTKGRYLHVGPAGQYPADHFKLVARQ